MNMRDIAYLSDNIFTNIFCPKYQMIMIRNLPGVLKEKKMQVWLKNDKISSLA